MLTPKSLPPRVPTLIFLNGPAGSGKTLLADYLCGLDAGITIYHHAVPLWSMFDAIMGLDPQTNEPLDYNLPGIKAATLPYYGPANSGFTVRDGLVLLGEWTRKLFGPEVFSHLAAVETQSLLQEYDSVVFPAIRTREDISRLISLGADRCVLLRLFRDGCSWENDLGYYLDPATLPGIRVIDLHNNGTEEDLFESAVRALGISE